MTEHITPENMQLLVQGSTPVQIFTMIFCGIIALALIIAIVKWVVDTKLATMPQDIKEIKVALTETTVKIAEVQGKLWSHDEIAREIACAVKDHALDCPARNK